MINFVECNKIEFTKLAVSIKIDTNCTTIITFNRVCFKLFVLNVCFILVFCLITLLLFKINKKI